MSDYKNSLEQKIVSYLLPIDKYARRTKASGASTELGDISCKYFFCECKQKLGKSNFIIDRKKDWLKLKNSLPIDTQKLLFMAHENKEGEILISMEAKDFFYLIQQIYKEK